jgi:hypothetical protein
MWKSAGRVPSLRVFTVVFALQLRKKRGKLSVRARKTSVRLRKTSVIVQYTYYQKTQITKPTQTHTLQTPSPPTHTHTPHTYTHTHIAKQYKTTTVQIKTNTVQDIPKLNSHNINKCPQYKLTLMYIAPLSTRTSP